ncbi:MAG: maleylacetoacetate isomerase [Cellvibrionaceae bacterium]
MKLYTYFRSSAAYRVRIALNLKALDYTAVPTNLREDGGQHRKPDYLELNPQALIPTLMDDGVSFTQSLAIIEYLDEKFPDIPLLPEFPAARAHIRAMALAIACDIHPLNNLRVLNYLQSEMGRDDSAIKQWYQHWILLTFDGLEKLVENYGGDYCYGNTISLADVCLIPQIANAKRFDTDLSDFPRLTRINDILTQHPAFIAAAPENQPDKG